MPPTLDQLDHRAPAASRPDGSASVIDALQDAALQVNGQQAGSVTAPKLHGRIAEALARDDAATMLASDLTPLPLAAADDPTLVSSPAPIIDALQDAALQVNGQQPGSVVTPKLHGRIAEALARDDAATMLASDLTTPPPFAAAADPTLVSPPAPQADPVPPTAPAPVATAKELSFLGGVAAELVEQGLLTERRAVALGFQARELGETLMRVISREVAAADLALIYQFVGERLDQPAITQKRDLIERIADETWLPLPIAEQRGILALRPERPGEAPYAAIDPYDLPTRDWVKRRSGCRPIPVPTLPDVLGETTARLRVRAELAETSQPLVPIDISWDQERSIRERPEAIDIPTVVDFIVHTAHRQGASDVHIEPLEEGTAVRVRIDGILHEELRVPRALHPAITSRIKVLAGMDVAERRRPQDGRITAQIRRLPLDIRVSSSPIVLGEKMVLRLLDEKSLRPAPEQLGLRDNMLRILLDKISAPHGLIMLSGPTGSGKTTTLYSCLSAIDRQRRNVLTIEDPVEYRLNGVHQMQVNERIGLTFASGLRNILRQDPDVIMVGECRDVDTARMAIQASLTGHVVFSTIHANDAVGVISRLIDMQIDPYLVATALCLPIAQRLVRAICQHCRTVVDGAEALAMLRADGVSEEKLARIGVEIDPRDPCHHASGCPHCRHTGYAGRQAVFEMFEITEAMRDLIAGRGFNAEELRRIVQASGATTMVENALGLVGDGLTTYAEIVRVFGDGTS